VLNDWGQRVTSLIPWGDSLIASTSAKWPRKWEPAFDFLADGKWMEYGAVTRLTTPGSLSVPVRCTPEPTELRFTLGSDGLSITQDGELLGTAALAPDVAAAIAAGELGDVTWGEGIFGAYGGAKLEGKVERP